MVVEQYGKIIEHGGIPTAHEITQIALQLPVIAAGGMAVPTVSAQAGRGRKGKGEVEMIVVDPSAGEASSMDLSRSILLFYTSNCPLTFHYHYNNSRGRIEEA
jgi:hypothetical protein